MKRKLAWFWLSVAILLAAGNSYSIESKKEEHKLAKEAMTIVKKFGGSLKPQLKQALLEGGVPHAIKICSVQAPEIARILSEETGWVVKRVSLKPRNKINASPDAWEENTLRSFDKRQQKGEMPEKISTAEVVGDQYRFMKAQGVEPLCLNCHGSNLSLETQNALATYYRDDVATGYSLGQVRGAFSLSKTMDAQR